MKEFKTKKNIFKKRASAIAYGLILIAAISVILLSVIQFVASQLKYTIYIDTKEKTFHIAESGIYFYRWYLAHMIEGRNQQEIEDFWNGNPLGVANPYVKDYLDNNEDKLGESEISVTFPSPGNYNIVEVTSTGRTIKHPGITRTVKAKLRRSIWSDFAVLSNAPICFDKYWKINGKVMGNNGVHFNGVAKNEVMAGVTSYNDTNPLHPIYNGKPGVWTEELNPNSVFTAGTKYPVPKKDFGGVTTYLQSIKSQASGVMNGCRVDGKGCYFDDSNEGRRIILKDNGTFDVCIVKDYWDNNGNNHHYPKKYKEWNSSGTCNDCSGSCLRNFNIPNNGVIFVENNIWLEGTINGKKISIAAASISNPSQNSQIYVMNSIKYTNTDGRDIMGIIAEGDIEILKNAPNDLKIYGALLSQNGKIVKTEYNPKCCGSGCAVNKNYLNIFGCVITKNGLDFGYHKESCPNIKLDRTITYDSNLYLNPPPFFPADSFYYVDFWKEL